MFFFAYDYKEYKDDVRDLYFDVSHLPGPVVKTQDELVYEIQNYKQDAWTGKYEEFNKKFNYLDGKDCGKNCGNYGRGKASQREKHSRGRKSRAKRPTCGKTCGKKWKNEL